MTLFSAQEAAKATVKEAADIVEVIGEHVALKKTGTRYTGLCPFHGEKTPSFSVNPQGQFYYCFGCGASGDVFSFVMQFHHLDFPEALKQLAAKYRIELPERQLSEAEQARLRLREQLYAVHEAISRYRLGFAPDPAAAGWDYLARNLCGQGFAAELLLQAGLVLSGKRGGHYDRFRSRVLFPLEDMSGRITAFGGRILGEGQPKYMNSPESLIFSKSRQLFGLYPHREAIRTTRRVLVVEGNFDLLLLAVHGIDNVVAPLGTALSREHVHSLKKYCDEVVLLFDADAAGLKAAMRSIPFFLEEALDGLVALLPKGHDPDSFVREQGRTAIDSLVDGALPLAEFVLGNLIGEHGLTLDGKGRIVEELKPLIQAATKREQRELMVSHFAAKLGVSASYFNSGKTGPVPSAPPTDPGPTTVAPLQTLGRQEKQLFDFLLFWPEYCGPLQEAGLIEVVRSPALRRMLELMEAHGAATASQPEYLLAAPLEPEERAYVIARLMQPAPLAAGGPDTTPQLMFDQLLVWVRQQRQRQNAASLQQQLQEAEQAGDNKRVWELLRIKQQGKKQRGDPSP